MRKKKEEKLQESPIENMGSLSARKIIFDCRIEIFDN